MIKIPNMLLALLSLSAFGSNLPAVSQYINSEQQDQIEVLIQAVRQAQKPSRNMRVKWSYELISGGASLSLAGRAAPAQLGGWVFESEAKISNIRSRVEVLRRKFATKDGKELLDMSRTISVFDGKHYRCLKTNLVRKEIEHAGRIRLDDENHPIFTKQLFGNPFDFNSKRDLDKYRFEIAEDPTPNIYILDAVDEYGSRKRFTIDGGKQFNIVRVERIRANGTTDYEQNYKLKQNTGGTWYIAGYEMIRHPRPGSDGQPRIERRITVSSVEFDIEIPDETFSLEFPPGTRVFDGIIQTWYTVGTPEQPILEEGLLREPTQSKDAHQAVETPKKREQELFLDAPVPNKLQPETKQEKTDSAPLATEAVNYRINLLWLLILPLGLILIILFLRKVKPGKAKK